MTTTSGALSAALPRYAERFHACVGGAHHVASPLGAWLLLALCGPAGTGRPASAGGLAVTGGPAGAGGPASASEPICAGRARAVRDEVAEALGLDVPEAARLAVDLLDHPHPLVGCAAALWHRLDDASTLSRWLAELPASVTAGRLPDQAGLDDWARRNTLGLIDQFPVPVTRETALVLATALATRVSWQRPFDVASASALGPASAWAGRVGRVLRTPVGPEHDQYIAMTGRAGEVAVHVGLARPGPDERARPDGLAVVSVIADPAVPAADVLAAAYELAPAAATGTRVARRSLFDLPLGESPLWALREERVETTAPDGREQAYTAVLPAWSAHGSHDLAHRTLGLPAAARVLASLLGPGEYGYEARQSAVARFHRVGFEAGAVSTLAVAVAYHPARPGLRRVAELRFGHPYAVVAVAIGSGPWHGLPVFSAWVTDIEEAS
jgi:hypothetical protein